MVELHWWLRDCWGDLVRTADTLKNEMLSIFLQVAYRSRGTSDACSCDPCRDTE